MMPEQCKGCDRVMSRDFEETDQFCSMYKGQEDRQHTRVGGCAGRTHNRKAVVSDEVKINPLKMSKRGIKQS